MGGDHVSRQDLLPTAEKAAVRWILKLDDYGLSPRVDILMGLVRHLAKDEERQVQVRNTLQQNPVAKNWISDRFLNRHPGLAKNLTCSRIDCQRAYAEDPRAITTHFRKLGKDFRSGGGAGAAPGGNYSPPAIMSTDERGF